VRLSCATGHKVYSIADTALVPLLHPSVALEGGRETAAEKRYRKLLLTGVDLRTDFFFSYTYCLSRTLQSNLSGQPDSNFFDSMFVWNDYLTRWGCVARSPACLSAQVCRIGQLRCAALDKHVACVQCTCQLAPSSVNRGSASRLGGVKSAPFLLRARAGFSGLTRLSQRSTIQPLPLHLKIDLDNSGDDARHLA
jgi:SacI homology domain